MILVVLAGLIGVAGLWLAASYNGLVPARQAVKNAWAQVNVQLKRRHDLIPNLVNSVKGYAAHEEATLERVIAARARATSASLPADVIKAEGELSSALARLLAVTESYPNLKANQNFLSLQEELTSTENRVAYARQFYNDNVSKLNTRIQSFPTVLIAGMFGFREEPFFEAPAESKEAPKVQF
jgi:LemA protein